MDLRKRILELSYKHKLSHIGSCLTALPILQDMFDTKPDKVVLSNGHAGLALYVMLESLYSCSAEYLLLDGIHPVRGMYVDCSTGSLGQGITVAVGFALAGLKTACLISDGECAEGSVWESLSFKTTRRLDNLEVYVNMNGFSALAPVDTDYLEQRLRAFAPVRIYRTHSEGLHEHYKTLNLEEYETAIQRLSS